MCVSLALGLSIVSWNTNNPSASSSLAGLKQEINVSAVTAYNLFDDSQPEKMGPAFSWHSANLHAAMAEHANRQAKVLLMC